MRRRRSPELTDEDLTRLAALGGATDQIAEAAGIDASQVRHRLAAAEHGSSATAPGQGPPPGRVARD